MEGPELHIEFDRFLSGEMTETETLAFEQKCNDDKEFAMAFSFYVQAKAAARRKAEQKQKEEFSTHYDKWAEKQQTAQRKRWMLPAIAAAIALLILAWFVFPISGKQDMAEIYAMYYESPGTPEYRGVETDSLLSQAHYFFQQDSFKQAVKAYRRLMSDSSFTMHPEASLNLGLALLELGEGKEALLAFQSIPASSPLKEMADWYSGFAWLQLQNLEKSRSVFRQLSGIHNMYGEKADGILKKLDKLASE